MKNARLSNRLDPMAAWLNRQALAGTDGGAILKGLCEQLLSAGLEIDRAVVAFLVFHPQFDGMNFTWMRTSGAVERQAVTTSDILSGPSPFLQMQSTGTKGMRYRLEEVDAPLPFPFLERLRDSGFTDYFAFFEPFDGWRAPAVVLPDGMALQDGISGSFGTARAGGLSARELAFLSAIVPPLAAAVRVGAILEMAETLLSSYLGASAGRNVLRGQVRRGQGRVIEAVIWHSDLRGSTVLAESVPLEVYLAILNSYYDCIVDAVIEHGGEVLKFLGDGVLAIFEVEQGAEGAACQHALAAARAALARLQMSNSSRSQSSQIRCGIALHSGNVMYGNVGSTQRLDFTVTGRAVNEVVRLEALCKTLDIPLVISETVAAHCREPLAVLGRYALPGIGQDIEAFSLQELVHR